MDSAAQHYMQRPTHSHLKVVTSADARAALFLVECLLLQPVRRRPDDAEKAQISHGQVFIWLDGAKGETGLERWTDGRSWGPSRCRDDFLIYEEKSGDHKLTKSTYTARRNTHGDPGALWHLIAYYYADETHTLTDMYTDPTFHEYTSKMAPGYFVSNRKDKSRKAKEVPPAVDASPLSGYADLVASLASVVSPTTSTQQSNNNVSSPHSHGYHHQHHHHQHHHQASYAHQHSYTHTNNAMNIGSPRLDRERASPSSAASSLVNQYENFSLTNDTSLEGLHRPHHARLSSVSSFDNSASSAITRRQDLPPLKTSFFRGSQTNGNNANDEELSNYGSHEESAMHPLTRHTMHAPKEFKKVLAADYHRLPPPASFHGEHHGGGSGHGPGGGGDYVRGRSVRGASVPKNNNNISAAAAVNGAATYYSSSPSPSSSSPGLSPTSSGSSPIEADMEMDIDEPLYHPTSHGLIRMSRERETTVMAAPTPVRAYSHSHSLSPPTPHASILSHHNAALPSHHHHHHLHHHLSLPRAISASGTPTAGVPGPAVAIPSSGSQTFERGGVGMMMIDMPMLGVAGGAAAAAIGVGAGGVAAPVRSREDEKVLHQFSKTWSGLF